MNSLWLDPWTPEDEPCSECGGANADWCTTCSSGAADSCWYCGMRWEVCECEEWDEAEPHQ